MKYTDFPVMDEPIFYSDRNLVSLARKAAEGIGRKILCQFVYAMVHELGKENVCAAGED